MVKPLFFFSVICVYLTSVLFSIGNARELAYYDPTALVGKIFPVPSTPIDVEILPNVKLMNIPPRFYGINIHPSSTKYEFARIDLLQKLKPDAVRIMTQMRVDWPLGGAGRVVSPVSLAAGQFDWKELDLLVQNIVSIGAEPYLALGFGPPQWISGASSPLDRQPPQFEKYEEYADLMATITYRYAVEQGHLIKRVTIDNEPENVGYAIDDYIKLVKLAKEKIKKKVPGIEVGGPSIGYAMWKQPNSKSLSFSSSVHKLFKESTPFDFFDWHIYAISPDAVMKTVQLVRNVYGSSLPLIISEFNRDWRYSGEHRNVSANNNTSWESVAWLAYLYDKLQLVGVDQVFYFAWREETLGLVDGRTNTLRPNFYLTSAMTNLIGRKRISSKTSHPAIGCIATNDNGVISALIYNMSLADVSIKMTGVRLNLNFSFSKDVYERGSSAKSTLINDILNDKGKIFSTNDTSLVVPAGGFLILKN